MTRARTGSLSGWSPGGHREECRCRTDTGQESTGHAAAALPVHRDNKPGGSPAVKKGGRNYPQLPEAVAAVWFERFVLHAAGGLSKRAQIASLYASAVRWSL